MMRIHSVFTLLALFATALSGSSQSRWVRMDEESGKWVYETTERGDRMLDFSHAGYMGGGVALPQVPEVLTVGPEAGVEDYTSKIQDAIDKVSSLPVQNGFRGAVRLLPGEYPCSESIRISADGVILRGSGSAADKQSTILMSGDRKHSAVVIGAESGQRSGPPGEMIQTKVTDAYVPAGSASFLRGDADDPPFMWKILPCSRSVTPSG